MSEVRKRFLAFSLAGEQYAVPLMKVKEVIALSEVTPVPHTPPHVRGIMNLRGRIISVIDLRTKFRMPKAEMLPEAAIIILDIDVVALGAVVDSVDCVLSVEDAEISGAPDVQTAIDKDFITGVTRKDKRLVLLLDIEKTLDVTDLAILKQQQQQQSVKAA